MKIFLIKLQTQTRTSRIGLRKPWMANGYAYCSRKITAAITLRKRYELRITANEYEQE